MPFDFNYQNCSTDWGASSCIGVTKDNKVFWVLGLPPHSIWFPSIPRQIQIPANYSRLFLRVLLYTVILPSATTPITTTRHRATKDTSNSSFALFLDYCLSTSTDDSHSLDLQAARN